MKLPRVFDMTISRSEFRRLLPSAVGHAAFTDEGDAFVLRENGRCWRISLSPLPQLRIGLIRLERQRVEFEFGGYSEPEIDQFMARFEIHFRRGGG